MSRTALVTGGTGFLGLHLSRTLADTGFRVRALDLNPPGPGFPDGVEFIRADVRNAGAVRTAADGCDVVIDNAARVPVTRASAEEYESVNVGGCRTALEAARRVGAYAVHISSSAIYGIPRQLPVTAETPFAAFEPYGRSKVEAERVVAAARGRGLAVASLRPRTLLGEGRLGIFDVIFARVRAGKRVPLFGRGDNKVQMCDVDDFSQAVLAAIERTANGHYNVGAAVFRTAREDIEALIAHAGTGACVQPIPVWAIRSVLMPLDLIGRSPFNVWHWRSAPAPFYFDISKTVSALGWEPRWSNAEALARAYDTYLERPRASGESAHRRPLAGALARALRGRPS